MAEDLLEKTKEGSAGELLDSNGASSGKKKRRFGNKKKLIIFFLSLVLLMSVVAGVWFFFFSKDKETTNTERSGTESIPVNLEPEEKIVFEDIVVLESFDRISLKSGSVMGLITLELALELIDHQYRKQVYTVQDRLRRVVTDTLGQRTWMELRTPEGKIRLKYDLLSQMNKVFPKVTIRNIYGINFLMQ